MTKVSAISWKQAAGLSCLAVYGPFIGMAIYTLLFVSCSHCKTTAWMLLPCAPGLLLVELERRWLDWPRTTPFVMFALAFMMSLAIVVALARLVGRGGRVRFTAIAFAFVVFSILAFCTLSMIRA